MKIAVLGAGLAGVELGRQLKELKKDFVIFEKETQIGGICRTNKTGGYCWDFGVHAIYSRSKEMMDYFYSLPLDYEYLDRNVMLFHTGTNGKRYILEYPFELGIKGLPLNDKLECIRGYLAARFRASKNHCSTLEEWVNHHLGAGIAKHFMTPYNSKIWNCQLSEISSALVNAKIEPALLINVALSAFGKKVVGRSYQAKFIYPRKGIQELINHTAKGIENDILLNAEIIKLIKSNNRWIVVLNDGRRYEVDMVISTIPLPELIRKININEIEKEYGVLKWNNTFFVMVGLKKGFSFQYIKNCHWVFFKEDEIFYRTTLMHNFSSEFSPVLVAEITQKGDVINMSEREIVNLVVKDLIRKGVVDDATHIAETDIKLLSYTYPIPTLGLEEVKQKISKVLEENNMFLLGRNGNWDYINMDGVILNAQKLITEKFLSIKGT